MIRAYTPDDYASLFRIYRRSFGPEFTERLLKHHLSTSSAIWVYCVRDHIAGYLLAEETSGDIPYLSQVAVDEEYRGAGIAGSLIKKFEDHYAPRAERVWLQVNVDNPSQTLYFKLGYRVVKFEPSLYGPGKHGLRMEKKF
jgi:ribosomal protein S18 acetylase RimI-like enzyme